MERSLDLWRVSLGWLVWFHRWAGVLFCLLFAAWFASGAVLLFVPFPSLPQVEQAARAEPVPLDQVRIAPSAALGRVEGATGLRLVARAGQPAYVISGPDPRPTVILADDGMVPPHLTPAQARAVGSAFAGQTADRVTGPFDYDQWVVHQGFDAARPLYRITLADAAGTQLYVSATTGQAVQRTTRTQRVWNTLGAVIHWIYVTPLRKSYAAWDQTVWWVSLASVAVALAGAWLGVYRMQKRMTGPRPSLSPFRGWLRWHHILGLAGGVFVLTWIVSGWLSMDHGRLFSTGRPAPAASARFAGGPLADVLRPLSADWLSSLGPASSVDFGALGGRPVIAMSGIGGDPGRTVMLDLTGEFTPLSVQAITRAVRVAYPGASVTGPFRPEPDNLYVAAEELSPDVLLYRLQGHGAPARLFVDGASGRISVAMDNSRRNYAWFYFAMHTFKLPGVIGHEPLRYALVLLPLALGVAFSLTGVIIGCRRLMRTAFPD